MPTRTEAGAGAPRRRAGLALVLLATALAGCSGGTAARPVDAPRALDALRTTLDAWKDGQTIDSLRSGSPEIVAQDLDWSAGAKLVAYEVEGDGRDNDVNLRVPVRLTLRTAQGKEVKKSVTYVIGTSPAVTVFRDFP